MKVFVMEVTRRRLPGMKSVATRVRVSIGNWSRVFYWDETKQKPVEVVASYDSQIYDRENEQIPVTLYKAIMENVWAIFTQNRRENALIKNQLDLF